MIRIQTRYIPIASILLAMLLWGSSFIALKLAFQTCHPMVVMFGRLAVASLCFLLFIRYFKKTVAFQKSDLKYIFLMAFCEPCLYLLFEAKALENTTASQAGMVTAIYPVIVASAAHIFLKEHIARRAWIGFIIAIIGVCWLSISGKPSENAPNPPLGNFLEIIAMICGAGYTIMLKRLSCRYPSLFLTAVQAIAGSIFYLPFLFFPSISLPDKFEPVSSLAIIYLGVGITFAAYGLYNFGVSRIPASQAASFVNLIPVFAIILSWLILGERFSHLQYIASFLILSGVFLCQEVRSAKAELLHSSA